VTPERQKPEGKTPMPGRHKLEEVVVAVLNSATAKQAAASLKISDRALRNWTARDDFKSAYAVARRGLLDSAIRVLQVGARKAAATLARHLDADRPADSIRAAESLLDRAIKGAELLDLLERVSVLEERLGKGNDHDRHYQTGLGT
jgi:hypothetical protein